VTQNWIFGSANSGLKLVLSMAEFWLVFLAWLAWKIGARVAQFRARIVEAKNKIVTYFGPDLFQFFLFFYYKYRPCIRI